jgi:hypothetical protein
MAYRFLIPLIFLIALSIFLLMGNSAVDPKPASIPIHRDSTLNRNKDNKISEAFTYIQAHHYDTGFCILVNYGLHSGKKRAYLVNPSKNLVFDSFLVSHGCGTYSWGSDQSKEKAQFSNNFESHCSSLGKYKIGKSDYSSWGINIKYLLYGLDSSNSNAYKRTIVLHGWGDIPDVETYPSGIPEGWGCPAVSDNTMRKLDSILQTRKKPVLMWIYH